MAEKQLVYRISFEGLDAQAAAIGQLDTELSSLNQTVKKQRDDLKLLTQLNQKDTEAYKQLSNELGKNVIQQRQLSQQKSQVIRDTQNEIKSNKEASGSINQLRAQLSLATKEYNALSKAERENINVGGSLQKSIKATSDQLKNLEGKIGDNRRNVGNYAGAIKEAGGALLGSFGISFGIGAAVTGLVTLGKELATTAKEVKQIEKVLTQTTNLTGQSLQDATVKVQVLSSALETDFNTVLVASNSLSKQFGITANEALQLIQDGFVQGANANGEFLQTLTEYPAQFKAIGISAKQSIDIITATANQGIYSDKGIDTIKEAGLALREQTKATQDALRNAFGAAFTDELLANINSGSITVFEGIQSVSSELSKLEPQSKEVGAVIADVFKGAGEDAGLAYLTSLKDIGNESKIVSEATKQLIAEQEKQLRLTEAQVRVTTILSDGFNTVKGSLVSYADEALTVFEQGSGFEKYLVLVTGGLSATAERSKELRDELGKLKEAQDKVFADINTSDVGAIKSRLEELTAIVANNGDQFGFASRAIEFYNSKLKEVNISAEGLATSINNLETLQKRLTDAQAEFNKAEIGSESFNRLRGEIKALQKQIEDINNPTAKGSIKQLQKRVSELQEQLNGETIPKNIRAITTEIEQLNKRIKEIPLLGGGIDEGDLTNFIPDPKELERLADEDVKQIKRIKDEIKKAREEFEKKFPSPDIPPFELPEIITEEQQRAKRAAEIQANVTKFQEIAQVTQDGLNTIAGINQAASQERLDAIENERLTQIAGVEQLQLSEEQKAIKLAEINKTLDAKALVERKKAAKEQLAFTLAQIALNTATSISAGIAGATTSGTATGAAAFVTTPLFIATTIATILGAMAQATAAVKASKKFADGGELPKGGGFIKGRSHAQGGVKFDVGGRVMEAEGGEIIVNKNIQSRPDFVQQISKMNAATGGVDFFAAGGVVAPKFNPQGANITSSPQGATVSEVATLLSSTLNNIQVVNNVTDTSSNQSMLIQIQNQTTI